MNALGFDLGRNWGWAFSDGIPCEFGVEKFSSMLLLEKKMKDLIGLYLPSVVVNCRAMGKNQQVIRVHGAMAGILQLICEKKDIIFLDFADSTMRKAVLGNGRANKAEVIKKTGVPNEHSADAMVAALYGAMQVPE